MDEVKLGLSMKRVKEKETKSDSQGSMGRNGGIGLQSDRRETLDSRNFSQGYESIESPKSKVY